LRDLRHHPERFLDPGDPGVGELVAEKQRLVARLEQAAAGERGRIGRRLQALGQLLSARTQQLQAACADELAQLGAPTRLAREARTIRYREYPWFLYGQTELRRTLWAGADGS
jgi:hypothetical protein